MGSLEIGGLYKREVVYLGSCKSGGCTNGGLYASFVVRLGLYTRGFYTMGVV